jgi:pimeloyl-ACP methyl ester carboxylesterase
VPGTHRLLATVLALILAGSFLFTEVSLVAAQDGSPTVATETASATPTPAALFDERLDWLLETLNEGGSNLSTADVERNVVPGFLEAVPAELLIEYVLLFAGLGPFTEEGYTRPPTASQANALLVSAAGLPIVLAVSVEPEPPHRLTGLNIVPVPPPAGVRLAPAIDASGTPTDDSERLAGLFDVGGGRQLYLSCVGSGSPTVILEAGLNDSAAPWFAIEQALGPTTRVCSYDRANTTAGASDPAPTPRSGREVVADLHALLIAAQVPGPYVLVGHSLGGIFARLYASTYPDEVAGLVLVDPSHEAQDERLEALIGPERFAQIQAMVLDIEGIDVAAAFAEVREAREAAPLLAMPLIVVSAGHAYDATGLPADWPVAEMQQLHLDLTNDLAGLAPDGRHVIAERSGHYVHQTEPEVVVAAIQQVVAAVRDPATWATPGAATAAA